MVEPPLLAVVIPVGPGEDPSDTVESILSYAAAPPGVVLVDDRGETTPLRLPDPRGATLEVIPAPPSLRGRHGALWLKVCAGIRHALHRFQFDLLLRIDTDALVLGSGLEDRARERLERNPGTGMLGSYRLGPDGAVRDFSPAARALSAECGLKGWRHPSLRRLLRELRREALGRGYEPGEHALGGAYFLSAPVVHALENGGLLDLPQLAMSRVGEDQLAALLVRAAGYGIADFGGPVDPMALRWKGLPASPEELLGAGKLVVHSLRSPSPAEEARNRAFFAAARRAGR